MVPVMGLNFELFAGVDTVKGITVFERGKTVVGTRASTSADRTNTKELGATFWSETENFCIVTDTEVFQPLVGNVSDQKFHAAQLYTRCSSCPATPAQLRI